MILLCIGDSITFGYGVLKKERFIDLIKSESIKVINRGINGDTTSGMLSRISEDLRKKNPTHILITGGANDFMQGRTVDYVYKNLNLMCTECKSLGLTPILGITPSIDGNKANSCFFSLDYDEVNRKISELRNIILKSPFISVDFYKALENKDFTVDGVHPNKNGHILMAEELYSVLKIL